MPKIEVKNVYKVFGPSAKQMVQMLQKGMSKEAVLKKHKHTVGVNNASFSVVEGEIFVVMGLSGSGKSTLIRCLNRLIEPTSGVILIDGIDVTNAKASSLREIRRRKMAMVFQNFALLPHKNVLENVAFGLEIQKLPVEQRLQKAAQILETVGLKGYNQAFPKELSGGMQQRVGLARALATDADILLMDEAFSALDPLIRKDMQDQLLSLQKDMKKTIVFITHDLDEALKIGDRIAIMKDGVIIQIGTPEEILHSPANDYIRTFTQDVNRSRVITAASIMRHAEHLIQEKCGVKIAARRMRDLNISSIFVCKKDGGFLGLVTIEDIVQQQKENKDDLLSIIHNDVQTVFDDSPIIDIIPLFFKSAYPVAVLNQAKQLVGIIFKSTILAGIAGEEGEPDAAIDS